MTSIETFKDQLARVIEGEVRFDPGSRALYATDASNYRLIPVGVVIPRHEEDVRRALALASENRKSCRPKCGASRNAGR